MMRPTSTDACESSRKVSARFFESAQVMHVLTEHFGRDQRHAAIAHEETLAVLRWIDARFEPWRKHAVSIDDAVLQHDATMHFDIGQHDGIFDVAIAVH